MLQWKNMLQWILINNYFYTKLIIDGENEFIKEVDVGWGKLNEILKKIMDWDQ